MPDDGVPPSEDGVPAAEAPGDDGAVATTDLPATSVAAPAGAGAAVVEATPEAPVVVAVIAPNGDAPVAGTTPPPVKVEPKPRSGLPTGYRAETHPPLRRMPNNRGFMPTLLSTAVFFITLAAAVTITTYAIGDIGVGANNAATGFWGWWDEWKYLGAPILGALVGLIGACAFALYNREYTQPDRVDPQLYGEIRTRLGTLDALLPVLCPPSGPVICDHPSRIGCTASCNEAWGRRDFINDELESRGSRWVLGSGYVDLYRQMHAAEEALYAVQPPPDVVGNALYDELRLNGADEKIENADALRKNIRTALPWVAGARIQLLPPPSDAFESPLTAPDEPSTDERVLGRVILRDVRRAISEFRDDERAKLVRARNQLIWTGTITAVAGYALLSLAVLTKAAPWAVIGGVIYYVVGAGVGLFSQLNLAKGQQAAAEDFGFARTSLFYVPVLSGLAAVGGVMLVALLAEATKFGADEGERSLQAVFDVRSFSLGLVIAAVFGYTPTLLLERLQAKANEYREALKLTSAAAGEANADS